MTPYLTTPRITLLELRDQYTDDVFDLDSDSEVMKHLTNGVPSTRDDVRALMLRVQNLLETHNGRFGLWAAIEKESQEFMGWFLFRPSKKDPENVKRIELGYRLKKKFWGKGIATEGAKAIIKKGFTEFPIDEIFAVTVTGNIGSQNVMKKAGLHFVKNFRDESYPGPLASQVEYALSRAEWSRTELHK